MRHIKIHNSQGSKRREKTMIIQSIYQRVEKLNCFASLAMTPPAPSLRGAEGDKAIQIIHLENRKWSHGQSIKIFLSNILTIIRISCCMISFITSRLIFSNLPIAGVTGLFLVIKWGKKLFSLWIWIFMTRLWSGRKIQISFTPWDFFSIFLRRVFAG